MSAQFANVHVDSCRESSLASVVLMPSCRDVFANEAHHVAFKTLEIPIATSIQEAVIQLELAEATKEESRACYCEKLDEVLALTSSDCIFERANTYSRKGGKGWIGQPNFILKSQVNGVRTYSIDITFCRTVVYKSNNLLTVKHAGLSGLDVVLKTFESDLPKQKIVATTHFKGKEFLPAISKFTFAEIAGLLAYYRFDELLGDILVNLNDKKWQDLEESALSKLREIDGIDYGPISHYLQSIFTKSMNDKAKLKAGLTLAREQVFDAPFLTQFLVPTLTSLLRLYSDSNCDISNIQEGITLTDHTRNNEEFYPEREAKRLKAILNKSAFEAKLPGLLQSDKGKFVAMYNGEILLIGADEAELVKKTSKMCKPSEMMVCEITDKKTVTEDSMGRWFTTRF